MTNPISPGALRAAEAIWKTLWGDPLNVKAMNRDLIPKLAAIIDESTGLPELLEALETLRSAVRDYLKEPSSDGRIVRREMRQKLAILVSEKKSEGTI